MEGDKLAEYQMTQRIGLPLDCKVKLTESRIKEWYNQHNGKVYVSFSGGKDSTVLLHIVRSLFSDIPAVFCDTGLEYPEIRDFVMAQPNIVILKPQLTFKEVINKHGLPLISKQVSATIRKLTQLNLSPKNRHKLLYGDERGKMGILPKKWRYLLTAPFKISDKCCEEMKERPMWKYQRATGNFGILGLRATDSDRRKRIWAKHGCFVKTKHPYCIPMAFWTEDDVWKYIKSQNIPTCSIYKTGVSRTGCMFCMFGLQHENKPDRFDLMKTTHPVQYRYCMNKLGLKDVIPWCDANGVYARAYTDEQIENIVRKHNEQNRTRLV